MVKTPCFHSRDRGFNPWSENSRCCEAQPKKKKKKLSLLCKRSSFKMRPLVSVPNQIATL